MMSALTNFDIQRYVQQTHLPNFRGVFMRDTLPSGGPRQTECGIVNLNTSQQSGSHWVCYFKSDDQHHRIIYFDSFGQITPIEIQKYLKTKEEFDKKTGVIQRNTDIVQSINSSVCGHLCLNVLDALTKGLSFQHTINILRQRFEDGHS